MGRTRMTFYVEAPPERVFALHTDPQRIPEWFPGVRSVSEVSGPLDQKGTRYTLQFRGPARSVCEVVEADPPHLHSRTWRATPLGSSGRATTRFEPAHGGTRVHFDSDYRLPLGPLGALLDRAAGQRIAMRSMRAEMDGFKALCEREARIADG